MLALAAALLLAADTVLAPSAPPVCAERLVPYAARDTLRDPAFALDLALPNGGRLVYVGAEHSTDPAHPQVARIEAAWRALGPTVAFHEGPVRPTAGTVDSTVRRAGESGLVRFLAARDGVPVARLEPAPDAEFRALAARVGAERALLFHVLREAVRLRDRQGLVDGALDAAVAALTERAGGMLGAGAPFRDLPGLVTAYARHLGPSAAAGGPVDWRRAPSGWFDPGHAGTAPGRAWTNDANRASSEFRDRHMYAALAAATLAGGRVFAVVGRDHVAAQAAALRCALGAR